MRKRENKNYRSVSFQSEQKKNSEKIEKNKKYRYGFILSQNRLEKAEKE